MEAEQVKETWKPVPLEGFAGGYEVSDLGRVRRVGKSASLRGAPTSRGYLTVFLYSAGKGKSFTVHRLVALAFLDGAGETVNHKDGDKRNNVATNLEWLSHSDNNRHAFATGLKSAKTCGEANNVKLTRESAEDALRLLRAGAVDQEIAAVMGVSPGCIWQLRAGLTWKELDRSKLLKKSRGPRSLADRQKAKAVLARYVKARKPQHPQAESVSLQPGIPAGLPLSDA